jgi:RNA polymerase sigma factor (TIGR02999 family)
MGPQFAKKSLVDLQKPALGAENGPSNRSDRMNVRVAPMSIHPASHITQLLNDVAGGRAAAADDLLRCVYDQLHTIAQRRMAGERASHTLQATALVHEAYLRLMGDQPIAWRDRGQFYLAAAESMRRILVDHARKRSAEKRGGGRQRLPLSVCDLAAENDPVQILALDQAIMRLQETDSHAAEVVRLRFFAGLTVEETAAALGISERTVKREWTYARAKLFRLLEQS